ncbi:hypothetical protein E2C01_001627 [Portunus trituberculatus]|uniref:Uncharacterized protein n=1 Tax=Portunus trituberculatus TaxID=210409 RepID=A0A5B7CI95_PORTR|nr:hypothetical protein [Portunus trituberculatus]
MGKTRTGGRDGERNEGDARRERRREGVRSPSGDATFQESLSALLSPSRGRHGNSLRREGAPGRRRGGQTTARLRPSGD